MKRRSSAAGTTKGNSRVGRAEYILLEIARDDKMVN
jgi:hypothetical protein